MITPRIIVPFCSTSSISLPGWFFLLFLPDINKYLQSANFSPSFSLEGKPVGVFNMQMAGPIVIDDTYIVAGLVGLFEGVGGKSLYPVKTGPVQFDHR